MRTDYVDVVVAAKRANCLNSLNDDCYLNGAVSGKNGARR